VKKEAMGFAEDGSGSLRSNRALDDRRHKRLNKVLNTFRKVSGENEQISKKGKKLSKAELQEFQQEMKEEKRRSDLKKVFALIASVAALAFIIYFLAYFLNQ
jgi:hypothetical protein